jgi:DNA-binding PadR family transcriptional regulator
VDAAVQALQLWAVHGGRPGPRSAAGSGATTRLLDRLEGKGLLRRERSTSDRRVVHVALTPEGQAIASQVPEVLCRVLNRHLSGFTHDEWMLLRGLLERILANGEALRLSQSAAAAQGQGGAS